MKRIGLVLIFSVLAVSKADDINPHGDEELGQVLIRSPKVPLQGELSSFRLTYRNQAVAVNKPSGRFTKGKGCLVLVWLDRNGRDGAKFQDCSVMVNAGKTNPYDLSLISSSYRPDASVGAQAPDLGAYPDEFQDTGTLSFTWQSADEKQKVVLPSTYGLDGTGKVYSAMLAGNLNAWLPFPKGKVTKTPIVAGNTQTVALKWEEPNYPSPGTVEVNPPGRKLPSASNLGSGWLMSCASFKEFNSGFTCVRQTPGNKSSLIVPLNDKKISYTAYPANEGHQLLMLLPWAVGANYFLGYPVKVQFGKTTSVSLKRLDIHDPEILKENGETYTVKGTYSMFRKNELSTWDLVKSYQGAVAFQTGTGMDLIPGDYKATVKFKTAEGEQTKDYFATLSNSDNSTDSETVHPQSRE